MVADTSLGLPYQQGTDRACDAPDVWCDFTNTLETLLLPIDTSTGRLSPARPCAKVARTTTFTVNDTTNPGGVPIPWETVVFDTDNMVDLTKSQYEITPQRDGTYYVLTTMSGTTPSTVTTSATLGVSTTDWATNPFFTSSTIPIHIDQCPMLETSAYFWRLGTVEIFTAATSTFGYSTVVSSTGSLVLTIATIMMAVYWVSDVV